MPRNKCTSGNPTTIWRNAANNGRELTFHGLLRIERLGEYRGINFFFCLCCGQIGLKNERRFALSARQGASLQAVYASRAQTSHQRRSFKTQQAQFETSRLDELVCLAVNVECSSVTDPVASAQGSHPVRPGLGTRRETPRRQRPPTCVRVRLLRDGY